MVNYQSMDKHSSTEVLNKATSIGTVLSESQFTTLTMTIIENKSSEKIEAESRTGDFIFFKPDVRHEVSKNNSDEHRLSIGINFGLDTQEECSS